MLKFVPGLRLKVRDKESLCLSVKRSECFVSTEALYFARGLLN